MQVHDCATGELLVFSLTTAFLHERADRQYWPARLTQNFECAHAHVSSMNITWVYKYYSLCKKAQGEGRSEMVN
jgi:hypothetical protein